MMPRRFALACLLCCATFVQAAELPPFQAQSPEATTIRLAGDWHSTIESAGTAPAGNAGADLDDTGWPIVAISEARGRIEAKRGDAVWYRQRILIPAGWKGHAVCIRLGTCTGTAEAFVNGISQGQRPADQSLVLLPTESTLRHGEVNTIAVRIADPDKAGGLITGPFTCGIASDLLDPAIVTDADSGRSRIDASGLWRFQPSDTQPPLDWQQAGFDDRTWGVLPDDAPWPSAGLDIQGTACFRRQVRIPSAWIGKPLFLKLGKLKTEDAVWLNGVRVGGLSGNYTFANRQDRSYALPATAVRYGEANCLAVAISGVENGNTRPGQLAVGGVFLELDPAHIRMRWSTEDAETPAEAFDVSRCQRGAALEIIKPLPADAPNDGPLSITLNDLYGNAIPCAPPRILPAADGPRCVIALDAEQSRVLYQRGGFTLAIQLPDRRIDDTVPYLSFAERDIRTLPPLPETWEETSFGRLRLIDEIDCSSTPETDEHPYIESGIGRKGQFRTPGMPAHVAVRDVLGKRCREADTSWFAYRIGRGRIAAHREYLVRIEYPEDVPRYASIEISNAFNLADVGWRNGVSSSDPYDDYPLSNTFQDFDIITVTDDRTYGSGGAESASVEHGFWVFVLDKGREAVPQYPAGPAISRIRLYEIDSTTNAPIIRQPVNAPQRTLMVDWERAPLGAPADMVRYCRLMGYNTVSPCILKWHFGAYWPAGPGYNHQPRRERSIYQQYLDACRNSGVKLVPRIEYGGSLSLPDAARSRAPDGSYAKPSRFSEWGANILNASTWDEISALIDELVATHRDNPQLAGVLWRMRCERIQPSFTRADIERYCRERSLAVPDKNDRDLAQWAASGAGAKDYAAWWQEKLHELHLAMRDQLRSIRPDLRLWYYHWDTDKFSLGPFDWFSAKNWGAMKKSGGDAVYATHLAERAKLDGTDYVRMIQAGQVLYHETPATHIALRADLYRTDTGISLLAPANYRYLSDDPQYLEWFRTADGVAMSNQITYDEHQGRMINPKHETNMIVPAGPTFSMANEVRACFHADPTTITYTAYTFGRGFAAAHRHFAQAYLALPAVSGTIIAGSDEAVRIRRYRTDDASYVGVVNRSFTSRHVVVTLPGTWPATTRVIDAGDGHPIQVVTSVDGLRFTVESEAMTLTAYVIR